MTQTIKTWQKINKETDNLSNIINQLNLTDIFKSTLQQQQKYLFFSSAYAMLSIRGHILGQKQVSINLKGLKPYKIFSYNHNIKNLEINKKFGKLTNLSKIEQYTLQWEIFWDEGKQNYIKTYATQLNKKCYEGNL